MLVPPRETLPPPYEAAPPANIAAIRAARAELYAVQAERRRVYLLTGGAGGARTKDVADVTQARADLDSAREAAQAAKRSGG